MIQLMVELPGDRLMARLKAQPMFRQQPTRGFARRLGFQAAADGLAQRDDHRIGDAGVIDPGKLASEPVGFGISDAQGHGVSCQVCGNQVEARTIQRLGGNARPPE